MAKMNKLPTIVSARQMISDAADVPDPRVTFQLEAENGELFELNFSLRGAVMTTSVALNWPPLREGLLEIWKVEPVQKR